MGPSDSPREVTAAAQQRAASHFAQNTIDELFEFSPDAIVIADTTGVIRDANSRTAEMFGYTAKELIGQIRGDCHFVLYRGDVLSGRVIQGTPYDLQDEFAYRRRQQLLSCATNRGQFN